MDNSNCQVVLEWPRDQFASSLFTWKVDDIEGIRQEFLDSSRILEGSGMVSIYCVEVLWVKFISQQFSIMDLLIMAYLQSVFTF